MFVCISGGVILSKSAEQFKTSFLMGNRLFNSAQTDKGLGNKSHQKRIADVQLYEI